MSLRPLQASRPRGLRLSLADCRRPPYSAWVTQRAHETSATLADENAAIACRGPPRPPGGALSQVWTPPFATHQSRQLPNFTRRHFRRDCRRRALWRHSEKVIQLRDARGVETARRARNLDHQDRPTGAIRSGASRGGTGVDLGTTREGVTEMARGCRTPRPK